MNSEALLERMSKPCLERKKLIGLKGQHLNMHREGYERQGNFLFFRAWLGHSPPEGPAKLMRTALCVILTPLETRSPRKRSEDQMWPDMPCSLGICAVRNPSSLLARGPVC